MSDTTPPTNWKRFFFESDQLRQYIHGPLGWQTLRDAHPDLTDDDLLQAREGTWASARPQASREARPIFGLQAAHNGERTLRDFFKEHGMLLPAAPGVDALIRHHLEEAYQVAVKELEARARRILRENSDLVEFVMSMGCWAFYDQEGLIPFDSDPRFEPVMSFISRWDDQLKLTGDPMRFTADGPVVTKWGLQSGIFQE